MPRGPRSALWCMYPQLSVLLMLDIEFCAFKTRFESEGGRRRSSGMPEVAVFKNLEIRASAFSILSHGLCCLQHGQGVGENCPLLLVSFFS